MTATVLYSLVIFTVFIVGQGRVVIDSLRVNQGENGLVSAETVCGVCNKITALMRSAGTESNTEVELFKKVLSGACMQLPQKDAMMRCTLMLEKHLPSIDKPQADLCPLLGLCPPQPPHEGLSPKHWTGAIVEASPDDIFNSRGTNTHIGGPVCSLCVMLLKKLEDMLPKEKTEENIVEAMGKVCDLLPDRYSAECNDFLQKYGKQVIDFLLSDAAPHTICVLLHLCIFENTPSREYPSVALDCAACHTLSALTRFHLGQNATETQVAALLENVCQHYPNAVPQCELLTRYHGPRLLRILGKRYEGRDVCEEEDFCQGQ